MAVVNEVPFEKQAVPERGTVCVVRSSKDKDERHTPLEPLRLVSVEEVPKDAPSISISAETRFQKFLGFGGAFTESSADLCMSTTPFNQWRIADAYFEKHGGLGYKFGRLHMNSCDFSEGNWSCCDMAGDVQLSTFSIGRYRRSIIPMVKRALASARAPIYLLASPWSPPAWMKTGGRMRGGSLLPQFRPSWAKHFVLFAQHFRAEGLPLWGFTVENEPEARTGWETCFFSDAQERDFIRDYLGPALETAGLLDDMNLIIWDHNRDHMYNRAKAVYNDPDAERYVWGLGFHWYEGSFTQVKRVHELRPDKHLIFTEGCQEGGAHLGSWFCAERYAKNILMDLNHWTEAWIDWNLVLDENGGPNHAGNPCSAPIMLDTEHHRLLYNPSYYVIGHFSRYIRPGAERIVCKVCQKSCKALTSTAFVNSNGIVAVVVMNESRSAMDFWLVLGELAACAEAPPRSVSTFTMNLSDLGEPS